MCTVSFVCHNDSITITSNRDEKVIRPSAIPPKNYIQKRKNIIYPKDKKAGGTWFAVDAEGTILVLLNGGLKKHTVTLPYQKSRGLIVLDVIGSNSPRDFWDKIDLDNIEPFTLVLYQKQVLYELIWDGVLKRNSILDATKNHIWSSVTLYSEEVRKERIRWFDHFLKEKKEDLTPQDVLRFHRFTEGDNAENGLVINRKDQMKTLSITQAVIKKNKGTIRYHDLQTQEEFCTSFISI